MIVPLLIVLVAAGLIAGDADSSSAPGAVGPKGAATSAGGSQGVSTGAVTPASDVGKTEPKIEFSGGPEPRGLEETDLVVGTGAEATPGTEVTLHYVIVLNKNGKEIESSWDREPYSFNLGSGEVADGWERGIEGMKEGGRRELITPSELAFGKAGAKAGKVEIGPSEDLLYVIDLLKVKPASASEQPPQSQPQQQK